MANLGCNLINPENETAAALLIKVYLKAVIPSKISALNCMLKFNMDYVIRKATREDCPDIHAMIIEMAVFENMEDQVKTSLDTLIEDGFSENVEPSYFAFVAEDKETKQIVAYALYFYVYCGYKGRQVYLEDIFVRDLWRKKGIATALIKKICATALAKGCSECRLACLDWNHTAMSLYKTLGVFGLTQAHDLLMFRFDENEMKNLCLQSSK